MEPQTEDISWLYIPNILRLPLIRGDGQKHLPILGAMLWNDPWVCGHIVGVVAHNYLDGKLFYRITPHQDDIFLIWTSGREDKYAVHEISLWKSDGNWENFTNLDDGKQLSSSQLVYRYYRGGHNYERLVLQTCIGRSDGAVFYVAYRSP